VFESRANPKRGCQLFGEYLSRKRICVKSLRGILLTYSSTKLQEKKMDPFTVRQLAQIRYQEMLQEAAEARAYRKAQIAHPNPVARKLKFAVAAIPVVLWILWGVGAG
jgi:hypothetical protein